MKLRFTIGRSTRCDRICAGSADRLDYLAIIAAFKAVVIEGVEVVLIVVAVGRGAGTLVSAALGAGAAAIVVVALGIMIHRPLTRVPENALKFGVVVIVSFGIFWLGEGMSIGWPGGDLAVLAIIAVVLALAHLCAAYYCLQSRLTDRDVPLNIILLQRPKRP